MFGAGTGKRLGTGHRGGTPGITHWTFGPDRAVAAQLTLMLNFTIAGDPAAVPGLAVFAQRTSGALSQLDAPPVRTFGPV